MICSGNIFMIIENMVVINDKSIFKCTQSLNYSIQSVNRFKSLVMGIFRHILFKWFDFKQDVYIFSLYLEREALYIFQLRQIAVFNNKFLFLPEVGEHLKQCQGVRLKEKECIRSLTNLTHDLRTCSTCGTHQLTLAALANAPFL